MIFSLWIWLLLVPHVNCATQYLSLMSDFLHIVKYLQGSAVLWHASEFHCFKAVCVCVCVWHFCPLSCRWTGSFYLWLLQRMLPWTLVYYIFYTICFHFIIYVCIQKGNS
jgi:hypothetical protein